MPFPECKVYYDGSHYIAIPHTTNRARRRKAVHEKITVIEKDGKLMISEPEYKAVDLDDDDEDNPFDSPQNFPSAVSLEEFLARASCLRNYTENISDFQENAERSKSYAI